jgi:DDE family transposase
VGRRDHRHAGPVLLAQGHAGDRPQERPHPGAQLRFTDIGGHRFTCFATSTKGGQLADLELRHRRRARCEDRIRAAKDTGLRNLPLHGYAQNQIWCEIVTMACELLAWMQMLALTGKASRRRRPPPAAAYHRDLALGYPDHRCDQPSPRPRARLTSRNPSLRLKGNHQGLWNPAHPARQPGHQSRPCTENSGPPRPQASQPRSRKIEAGFVSGPQSAAPGQRPPPQQQQIASALWRNGDAYLASAFRLDSVSRRAVDVKSAFELGGLGLSKVHPHPAEGTFQMKVTASRPKIAVSADGSGIVSQGGALLLTQALRAAGLDRGLAVALERWRASRAVHDPGKIIADLVVTLALGGDCLADIAAPRAQPGLFGPVASDPVVSRLVSVLAADAPRAVRAIGKARAAARERAWALAGDRAPGAEGH